MFSLIKYIFQSSDERIRNRADARIRRNISRTVSRRLNLPLSQVVKTLDNPTKYIREYQTLQGLIKSCLLTFIKESDRIVELSMRLEWENNEHTVVSQKWLLSEVPVNIQSLLINHNKPVEIDWKLD